MLALGQRRGGRGGEVELLLLIIRQYNHGNSGTETKTMVAVAQTAAVKKDEDMCHGTRKERWPLSTSGEGDAS